MKFCITYMAILCQEQQCEGSITLHPMGIPHGPQPGETEASIGKKETDEYAIMIDTFNPLKVTNNVKDTMAGDYSRSWIENK